MLSDDITLCVEQGWGTASKAVSSAVRGALLFGATGFVLGVAVFAAPALIGAVVAGHGIIAGLGLFSAALSSVATLTLAVEVGLVASVIGAPLLAAASFVPSQDDLLRKKAAEQQQTRNVTPEFKAPPAKTPERPDAMPKDRAAPSLAHFTAAEQQRKTHISAAQGRA